MWDHIFLGDIVQFKNGKKRPLAEGDIPVYGGNGILGYTNIGNHTACIIIGRVGAYCGNVFYEPQRCWISDNAIAALPKNNTDILFLYYLLKQLNLNKRHIGTSQPLLTQEILNHIPCVVPDIRIQKQIAGICRVLDEKIQVNQKINETLQQQAQAIYTSVFAANAGSDWQQGHLSDLITVKYGKGHKKLADGDYPVYGSGGIMRYAERPLYDKESVLIPGKGTLNNVMYVNEPFWAVDTMFYTEMKFPDLAKFVFHFVKSKDLASLNAGSAVPSMTTDILNAMELSIPDMDTLRRFEDIVAPMYKTMEHSRKESKKLAALLDTLLPRLMSGEVDVSNILI